MNSILEQKIKNILKAKKLSLFDLEKKFKYSRGPISEMFRGKRHFTEHIIEKILPILEVSREEFESWILADKYPKEVLELAKEEACHPELVSGSNKLILTIKIDEILKQKGLSRTKLAKQIGHSQSGLNRVIIGKEPLSENVVKKLAPALEVSENTIKSWVVADKYPLKLLQLALDNF